MQKRATREIEINPAYDPIYDTTNRIMRIQGGAGSGKSFEIAQLIATRIMTKPGHRALVFRKIGKTVKFSVFQEFIDLIDRLNLKSLFKVNKAEHSLTFTPNGNFIVCLGLDDPEKIKSIKDPTIIWMEEATEFTHDDFIQLNLRLRKSGILNQIILTYNPINKTNWVYKHFDQEREYPNHFYLKTTYRDNFFNPTEYITYLENLINIDENYYKVYALGDWGDIVKGLIYPEYEIIDEFPHELCKTVLIGGDFGFTDPTAVVRVGVDSAKQNLYIDELIYETGLTDAHLANVLENKVGKDEIGYFDAAAPGSIQSLNNAGWRRFTRAKKDQGSINAGIKAIQAYDMHVTARSTNVIRELNRYKIAEDRHGEPLDKPIDAFNHALDAMRYPIYTHFYQLAGPPMATVPKTRRKKIELR